MSRISFSFYPNSSFIVKVVFFLILCSEYAGNFGAKFGAKTATYGLGDRLEGLCPNAVIERRESSEVNSNVIHHLAGHTTWRATLHQIY